MQVHAIDVTPKLINNVISWELCYKNPNTNATTCGGPPTYVPVVLDPGKVDQIFYINIKDPNLGIKFPATIQEALWIQADDKPLAPVIEPKHQILSATRVNDSTVVFIDKNNGSQKLLKYQLNFVGRDNNKVTAIDPDIKNGGGKILLFGAVEAVAAFLIGAAVTLTIAMLWFRKMGPKRSAS